MSSKLIVRLFHSLVPAIALVTLLALFGSLVLVTAPASPAFAADSTDVTLTSLTISSGTLTPAFASGTTSYTDSVANSVSSVTVTPTANDASGVVILVNLLPVSSGSASGDISLSVGSNTITILVIARDLTTARLYSVTVTRAPPSSDATLSDLAISSGTLTPVFASGTTSYTDSVANSVSSVTVTPTANESHATIEVNGTAVAGGGASGDIGLSVGTNTITILVTAEDGTTTDTYTVTVTRPPLSSDATLSGLNISSGTLTPAFASGTTSYTDSVANSVSSVTVTPTANESHATIEVNGTAVASGGASGDIGLRVGDNAITILVTAQDGTTDTYTVTVTRAAAPTSTPTVITSAATTAATTSATLNGDLTALGTAASVIVSFEWGTSTSYGSETTAQSISAMGTFSANLTGLSANTTYHFRAKAVGAGSAAYGDDMSFTTTARSGDGMPSWAWVLAGLVVVGVVGAAAFFVRRRLAKK